MTVWGYARVSTQRQAQEGESLEVQQRQIEGYALQHGFDLAGVFVEEGVSGSIKLTERPQAAQLMGCVQAGDTIVTPKLDRMFRSALDALDTLETLKKQGVSLHMIDMGGDVTSNGVSKLVFTILSAVAESERERIRERVSTVKADQRRRGEYLGGVVPFGYKMLRGKMIENPETMPARQELMRLIGSGTVMSLRKMRKHVAEKFGVSPSHLVIHRMVNRAKGAV